MQVSPSIFHVFMGNVPPLSLLVNSLVNGVGDSVSSALPGFGI